MERLSNDCLIKSNHAIVLVLVGFLIGSKKRWVITLPIRNKQGIAVGLSSKSSGQVKPSVVLVSFSLSRHLVSNGTDMIGFTFAFPWFVKANKLLRKFHRFVVGLKQ